MAGNSYIEGPDGGAASECQPAAARTGGPGAEALRCSLRLRGVAGWGSARARREGARRLAPCFADGAAEGGDPQLTVERFDRTPAQDSRMGLAMPDEFLPYEGEQGGAAAGAVGAGAELPASAAGRLILRVEGQAEAASFLASYAQQPAAATAGEQGQAAAAPAGVAVEVATQCSACGAAAGGEFAVAVHRPAEAAVASGFPAGSVIVCTSCSRCSAMVAEVRSTGGVAPRGARIRQVLRERGGRAGRTLVCTGHAAETLVHCGYSA